MSYQPDMAKPETIAMVEAIIKLITAAVSLALALLPVVTKLLKKIQIL